MTTIFINRYFHPDHSATSQMLSDLAFSLAARGEKICIVTSRQRYDAPEHQLAAREAFEGVDIHRVWTTQFGRRNLMWRSLDYFTFYFSAAIALWHLSRKGDVVVAMTDPPMLSVVAVPIARLRGARLVNWLQDLFPEVAEAVGLGHFQLPSFIYGALRAIRNRSLRAASKNVVLGERMAERLRDIGIARSQIAVVPNWADRDLVKPVAPADNPLRAAWSIADDFVVGYSGNLGRAHDYGTFLDAIELLERVPAPSARIRWLFIGGGALYDSFRQELETKGLDSAVFKPYQPRERLSQSLSASDVHIVHLRPALEGLIVPSKFYGIAAAGRAAIFIGDQDGELARVIRRENIGFVVSDGDGAGLAECVRSLAERPERSRDVGARARVAFDREFHKGIAIKRWAALLEGSRA